MLLLYMTLLTGITHAHMQLLRDTHLLLLVGGLVLLDSTVISVWVIQDPMHRRVHTFPPKVRPRASRDHVQRTVPPPYTYEYLEVQR